MTGFLLIFKRKQITLSGITARFPSPWSSHYFYFFKNDIGSRFFCSLLLLLCPLSSVCVCWPPPTKLLRNEKEKNPFFFCSSVNRIRFFIAAFGYVYTDTSGFVFISYLLAGPFQCVGSFFFYYLLQFGDDCTLLNVFLIKRRVNHHDFCFKVAFSWAFFLP